MNKHKKEIKVGVSSFYEVCRRDKKPILFCIENSDKTICLHGKGYDNVKYKGRGWSV